MPKRHNIVLEVTFSGQRLNFHNIPIYDLGVVFVSIQRILHKAHLSNARHPKHHGYPARRDREMLALQIGEQRHGSDVFALVPVLTDQISLSAIRQAADYLVAGLASYAVGTVLDRIRSEPNESTQMFIGNIYADTVNIVNRVGNVGGCERIEISSPTDVAWKDGRF